MSSVELRVEAEPFEDQDESLRDKRVGQRYVRLVDPDGVERGSLMWRIASGYTVEICEFAINSETDRRQGWGTRLMAVGIADMRDYYQSKLHRPHRLLKVWLLAETSNVIACSFYKAIGFVEETVLKDFYLDWDSV